MNHAFQYLKSRSFAPVVNRFISNEGKKRFTINLAKKVIKKNNIRKFSTYSNNNRYTPPPPNNNNNNNALVYAVILGSCYKTMYDYDKK